MANLSLKELVRYVPNIPGNKALPPAEQISFSITAGLSTIEMSAFTKKLNAVGELSLPENPTEEQRAEFRKTQHGELNAALADVVKINPTETTLDGVKITSLAQYLEAVGQQIGWLLMRELVGEVTRLNSLEGQRALFSERSSGGTTSTR